jgi:hypothetical protein
MLDLSIDNDIQGLIAAIRNANLTSSAISMISLKRNSHAWLHICPFAYHTDLH